MHDRYCISDNKAAWNGGSRQAVHGQGCKSQEILIEWRNFMVWMRFQFYEIACSG